MREFSVAEIVRITGGELLGTNIDYDKKVTNLVIDSRKAQKGSLFVTIVGEKNDAHRFLDSVFEAGATAAFISRKDIPLLPKKAYILVDNTIKAAQDLALFYRNELSIPIVGITGSVGKTTTREMIAIALSAGKKVFKTKANLNSQIGVPLTIMEIKKSDEIAVIEMGISEIGEMHNLSRVVKPNVAVVTNIGTAHIENLGSTERIRNEKFRIQDEMPSDGKLLLNYEDDILRLSDADTNIEKFYFGGDTSHAFATNIELIEGCPKFRASILGETVEVKLSVYGKHQVLNALVALFITKLYGVDLQEAAKALNTFCGFTHRQQILKKEGYIVIDDTYNASPASMKAAIDILQSMKVGHRVAILADMKELGENEIFFHQEIGEYLAKAENIHELWYYGTLAREIALSFSSNFSKAIIREFKDLPELKEFVLNNRKEDSAYLLKASNSMRLMEIADEM